MRELYNRRCRKGYQIMSKEEYLHKLSDCVVEMENEKIVDVVKQYIGLGYYPKDGMLKGLVDGMKRVNELYEQEEYDIPELLLCSDTMNVDIDGVALILT